LPAKERLAVFPRAIRLREALYSVCAAKFSRRPPKDSDVTVLNEEIRLARAEEKLVFGKTGFDWRWSAPDLALDRVLWRIARSTAELLTQDGLSRLRQCGGKECGWIFLDTS